MITVDLGKLSSDLQADEGTRFFVYDDATGKPVIPGYIMVGHPTIGVGRALDVKGISAAEAMTLLGDDEKEDIETIDADLPWIVQLSELRQRVIVEMAFQIGTAGLLKFYNMIAALKAGNYDAAATCMLQSLWAKQTPARARKLAMRMSSNEDNG